MAGKCVRGPGGVRGVGGAGGVGGPPGPLVFLKNVPYPSDSNDAFTPYTVPSSRSQLGGGKPIYITNIRRLPDGRITFYLGYVYE